MQNKKFGTKRHC